MQHDERQQPGFRQNQGRARTTSADFLKAENFRRIWKDELAYKWLEWK